MSRINEFLNEAGLFFLATVDGGQPKLRPLGLHFEMDGKVLFGVGDQKDVYKQMLAEPKVEIAAAKPDGHWLRYTGKAVFETDPKYSEKALELSPGLRDIYNETTGNRLAVFSLTEAEAYDIAVMGKGEKLI
ncbi:MAG: pyridoxamine 5'-phosphate oxidase family protein [Ruminococcus sp.]|nr:pyridoxamine 5'-phosphate oxidase family protein [Ruminococcus sp.]